MLEIRRALNDILESDPKALLLGQDIRDPYGGCFRVTQGLSRKHNTRVLNTPISESALIGMATGLSMRGYRPIVEIMFYDFMTLALDQLLNHACLFPKIWNIKVPLVIRTAIGKGVSPVHNQDLDNIFKNVLPIYHPTLDDNPYDMFWDAYRRNEPVLFVEDSKLYKKKVK
jgi:pyruvate/2-oxoglutarate/acetoin dehydrogenase E1 component